jgi:hypothetical protein
MNFLVETFHSPTRICEIMPICMLQIKQKAVRNYLLPSKATGSFKKQCPDRWPMVGAFDYTQTTPTTV